MSNRVNTVLVLGASGMLGHRLVRALADRFYVVGTFRGDTNSDLEPALQGLSSRYELDVRDFERLYEVLDDVRPKVVVNCIGIVKQILEARDPELSISINSLLPHRLAPLCRQHGCRLIHFSTDCVFSGRKGNYTEDDVPDPVDLYGRTKLLGEVDGSGCLTLRTSIIGRELRNRRGLLEWFIRQRGGEAEGYDKAIYSGLTTLVMARLVAEIVERHPTLDGLWHVSAEPISKYELLCLINEALRLNVRVCRQTSFCCDRSLNSDRFRQKVGFCPPSWPEMVAELAADPTPYSVTRPDEFVVSKP